MSPWFTAPCCEGGPDGKMWTVDSLSGQLLIAGPDLWDPLAWLWPTRTIRAQVLSMRERAYVHVARLSGASGLKIIFTEMMPNLLPYLAASLVGAVAAAVLASLGLDLEGVVRERRIARAEDQVPLRLDPELRAQRRLHVDLAEDAEALRLQFASHPLDSLGKRQRRRYAQRVAGCNLLASRPALPCKPDKHSKRRDGCFRSPRTIHLLPV